MSRGVKPLVGDERIGVRAVKRRDADVIDTPGIGAERIGGSGIGDIGDGIGDAWECDARGCGSARQVA